MAGVDSYRTAMRTFAAQPILDLWYAHVAIEEALADYKASLDARTLRRSKADLKAAQTSLASDSST